ncbi:MAG TPA: transcriptional regulator [Acetobacteraceae bacterium]|nr:transcriptional regulator [Acetobacteraceae bacterium]
MTVSSVSIGAATGSAAARSDASWTPVRPIRTEADRRQALAGIDALKGARPGTLGGDRLEVLVTLVDAYEARHAPPGMPDPIEAIRLTMERKRVGRRELEPAIGSRARVAEILNRRRALTLPMIRKLCVLLELPAYVLIQAYALRRDAG